jgi:hypothetical protein
LWIETVVVYFEAPFRQLPEAEAFKKSSIEDLRQDNLSSGQYLHSIPREQETKLISQSTATFIWDIIYGRFTRHHGDEYEYYCLVIYDAV